jgi:hypothetical protein
MVEDNWPGILRWFHSKVSNGLLEGLNSLVQAAKRRARGYRSPRNYIAMIYLVAGKLDLGVTHAKLARSPLFLLVGFAPATCSPCRRRRSTVVRCYCLRAIGGDRRAQEKAMFSPRCVLWSGKLMPAGQRVFERTRAIYIIHLCSRAA